MPFVRVCFLCVCVCVCVLFVCMSVRACVVACVCLCACLILCVHLARLPAYATIVAPTPPLARVFCCLFDFIRCSLFFPLHPLKRLQRRFKCGVRFIVLIPHSQDSTRRSSLQLCQQLVYVCVVCVSVCVCVCVCACLLSLSLFLSFSRSDTQPCL